MTASTRVPRSRRALLLMLLVSLMLVTQTVGATAATMRVGSAGTVHMVQFPPKPVPCTQGQLPDSYKGVLNFGRSDPTCLEDFSDLGDGEWAPLDPTATSDLTITPSISEITVGKPMTFTLGTSHAECPTGPYPGIAPSGCWAPGGEGISISRVIPRSTATQPAILDFSGDCGYESLVCHVTPTQTPGSPPVDSWVIVSASMVIADAQDSPYEKLLNPGYPGEFSEIAMRLSGPGPQASFTATPFGTGDYQFASTSQDTAASITQATWDFGDEAKGSGATTSHTYSKPGTYSVTLTVTDSDGNTEQATQQLTVAAPQLGVSIFIPVKLSSNKAPPSNPSPGDQLQADITVSAGDGVGDLSQLGFDGGTVLAVSPTGAFDLVGGNTGTPPPFELAPNTNQSFSVSIQAVELGLADFTSVVTGVDASGTVVRATGDQTIQVGSAIPVVLTYAPTPLQITLDAQFKPIALPFAMTVMVTNPFTKPLENVTLGKNPSLSLVGADIAVPVEQDPNQKPPDRSLGTLAPGASVSVVFPFLATTDGQATVAWTVSATNPDNAAGLITGAGATTVTVEPSQLVEIKLTLDSSTGNSLVQSGSAVTENGTVVNLTNAQVVNLNALKPTLTGNGGGGNPIDPDKPPPADAYPLPIAPTLQPGAVQAFTDSVQTVQGQGTRATVNYTLSGTADYADGTTPTIAADQVVYSPAPIDGSDGVTELIHINDQPAPPATAANLQSEVAEFTTGFTTGCVQWLASTYQTVAWLATSAPGALATVSLMPLQLLQTVDYQVTYWAYLTPGARGTWIAQIAQGILAQTTKFGKDLGTVENYVNTTVSTWMNRLSVEWYGGDYAAVASSLGQVSGNVALEAASWSIKLPEAAELLKPGDATKEAGVASRVGAGLSALQAGDDLTQASGSLETLFGIDTAQAAALQELAIDKGLLIAARPRNPLSIAWEALGAVLKPELIKIKTVSDVDVAFLGYGSKDLGSAVFKKPITLQQLESSAAYTAAPAVEQQAAIAQLQSRTNEWSTYLTQYTEMTKPVSQGGGISMAFDNVANGAAAPPNATVAAMQKFSLTQAAGEPPGYLVMYIGGHRVTGDIDLVAVTLADGSIPTAAERGDIFDNLVAIIGIQHGDTLSWLQNGELLSSTKADLLSKHVPGGQPLVVFDPTGAARASFIQPQYTFFNKADNAGRIWYVGGYRTPLTTAYHFGQLSYPMFSSTVNTVLQWLTPAGWIKSLTQSSRAQSAVGQPQLAAYPLATATAASGSTPSHALTGSCTWQFSLASSAGLVYPNGKGGLQQWLGNRWQPLDLGSCSGGTVAQSGPLGSDGVLQLLPQTSLQQPALAGSRKLVMNSVDDVFPGMNAAQTPWFQVGQSIIIGAGTATQETATVVSPSPLTLNHPLAHTHSAGTMISVYPAPQASSTVALVAGGVVAGLLILGVLLLGLRRQRRPAVRVA